MKRIYPKQTAFSSRVPHALSTCVTAGAGGPGAEPACASRRSACEGAADGTAGVLVVLVLCRDRVMST